MYRPPEQRFLDIDGRLTQWPTKHSYQLLVLAYLATKFAYDVDYTEAQVNELLRSWHTFGDWPLLRRGLVSHGFLTRTRDGSQYHVAELPTTVPDLVLVRPDIIRDPALSVGWLAGLTGSQTLCLMGNAAQRDQAPNLAEEQRRIRDFITSSDQITWMLRFRGRTVGAIWLSLVRAQHLPAPALHIMIGDPDVRGHGLGSAAVERAVQYAKSLGRYPILYTRHLVANKPAERLFVGAGFIAEGPAYQDEDGLTWQNRTIPLR